ncbi:sugar ABC transporter substrate-binding protein [Haladaptatus halobius]|uniref:sugar ABC transporter substrate-binding protein n=1 Tax=Haladaptatus halobius TaxID=2884875 RepID=UPI001D0AC374|nr:sugar ABC transporter substrate-binding protein [Haladaptatus halobius]
MDRIEGLSRRKILKASGTVAIAGLAGCLGGDGGGGGKPDSITYWDWGDHYKKPTTWFEKKHGVKIDYQQFPFENYVSKVISAGSAGNLPDTMNSSVLWVPRFADQNIVVPLEEHGFKAEDYIDAATQNASYEGKLYAIPTYVDCRLMALNEKMFKQAGLEIPERTYVPSWDDFEKWATELNKEFKYGVSLDGGEGFDNFVLANGGNWVNDPKNPTKAIINNKNGVKTAEYIKSLIDKNVVRMRYEGGSQTPVDDFTSETAPMAAYVGSWELADINNKVDANWRYLPMPKGPNSDSSHSWSAGNFLLATEQGNTEWALKWLEFANTERVQKHLLENVGGFPGLKSIYKSDFFKKFIKKTPNAQTIKQEISNTKAFPRHPKAGDMYTLVHTEVEAIWQGKQKPQPVLDRIANEINSMIES